jgi:hypothetical protein
MRHQALARDTVSRSLASTVCQVGAPNQDVALLSKEPLSLQTSFATADVKRLDERVVLGRTEGHPFQTAVEEIVVQLVAADVVLQFTGISPDVFEGNPARSELERG